MAATGANDPVILVVGRDWSGSAVPFASLCRLFGAPTAAQAIVELTGGRHLACLLADAMHDQDLRAVAHATAQHGVMAMLWSDGESVADYERALQSGCRAVVGVGANHMRQQALLQAAADHQHQQRLERHDLDEVSSRYEALRRRSQQQAQRFQVIQETYFLDLSRAS